MLGYPEAALADSDHALKDARELGEAATLMYALFFIVFNHIFCGDYGTANAFNDELITLAEQTDTMAWKPVGRMNQGCVFSLTGKASNAVQVLTSGITALRSTGSTVWLQLCLPYLASAHADLGQFDDAWRCIEEATAAVVTTKLKLWEAEVYRVAGELVLMRPKPDAANAETYFDRALAVACQQQAKSWELRAAMSLARLWRDQGKVQQARELLAPVYGWFSEGFDTRDLKEAKALLEELAA
jgi:predicted ATPase